MRSLYFCLAEHFLILSDSFSFLLFFFFVCAGVGVFFRRFVGFVCMHACGGSWIFCLIFVEILKWLGAMGWGFKIFPNLQVQLLFVSGWVGLVGVGLVALERYYPMKSA